MLRTAAGPRRAARATPRMRRIRSRPGGGRCAVWRANLRARARPRFQYGGESLRKSYARLTIYARFLTVL